MSQQADLTGRTAEDVEKFQIGVQILRELLARAKDGTVSTQALRKELETRAMQDPQEFIARLKSVDADEASGMNESPHWYHFGRSFYTEAKYREVQQNQAVDADQAEAADDISPGTDESDDALSEEAEAVTPRERRDRRKEEARLGRYILPVLEEIYDDEASPEDYVFDVHSMRGGNDFENVDLLAIHWRSAKVIDIVTVEVKLKFTSFLVQQARNYARFSERVWIALPVSAKTANSAAMELRALNQLLFEHVVESGMGILGCHKGRGGAYEVFPIHWPRRNIVDPREREEFITRYRQQFEESGVIPPVVRSYPKL